VRNPANAPSAAERTVLEEFERRRAAGEPIGALEHFEPASDGSGARFMKAIPTEAPCLVCHGESLAEPVRQAVTERYPSDAAQGFRAGDIRGAFVVEWTAE
jgi:hypothetical protein